MENLFRIIYYDMNFPKSYRLAVFPALIFIFITASSYAQNGLSIDSVTGTWKGSSKCQIKDSPCHDEVVVYHITRNVRGDTCIIQANKMVHGVEEDMGILHFSYDPKTQKLKSTEYNSLWEFHVSGKKMDGTLIHNGSLYRIIKLDKTY